MNIALSPLLWSLALCGLATTAHAQSNAPLRFGVRGGLNLSTQQQSVGSNGRRSSVSNDNLTGFHAGIVAEVPLAGDLSLRPELLFSRKGLEYSYSALGQSIGYTDKLSYLTLPVSLTYRVHAGPAALVLGAGPYVGVLVNAERTGSAKVLGSLFTRTGDLNIGSGDNDDYQTVDAGLNFQGLVEVDRVFVGAHYGLGLTNVQAAGHDDDNYRRNRGWEFTLGVYLSK